MSAPKEQEFPGLHWEELCAVMRTGRADDEFGLTLREHVWARPVEARV